MLDFSRHGQAIHSSIVVQMHVRRPGLVGWRSPWFKTLLGFGVLKLSIWVCGFRRLQVLDEICARNSRLMNTHTNTRFFLCEDLRPGPRWGFELPGRHTSDMVMKDWLVITADELDFSQGLGYAL